MSLLLYSNINHGEGIGAERNGWRQENWPLCLQHHNIRTLYAPGCLLPWQGIMTMLYIYEIINRCRVIICIKNKYHVNICVPLRR